jgi:hypothetical protein
MSLRLRVVAGVIAPLLGVGVAAVPMVSSAAENHVSSAATAAAAKPHDSRLAAAAPIDQTIAGVGRFVGTFTPGSFGVTNGQLTATGVVTGIFTPVSGAVQNVSQTVTDVPVQLPTAAGQTGQRFAAAQQVSCRVLDLTLGPIHLDLLGLVIDLNQVHLTITAVPGAGNLLGNLLCAIAGLLNGGLSLNNIATILNFLLLFL